MVKTIIFNKHISDNLKRIITEQMVSEINNPTVTYVVFKSIYAVLLYIIEEVSYPVIVW